MTKQKRYSDPFSPALRQGMERACYTVLREQIPQIVDAIEILLDNGQTPEQIDTYLESQFPGNFTAGAAALAARHIERLREGSK